MQRRRVLAERVSWLIEWKLVKPDCGLVELVVVQGMPPVKL